MGLEHHVLRPHDTRTKASIERFFRLTLRRRIQGDPNVHSGARASMVKGTIPRCGRTGKAE
jgi:hypothetical protein